METYVFRVIEGFLRFCSKLPKDAGILTSNQSGIIHNYNSLKCSLINIVVMMGFTINKK